MATDSADIANSNTRQAFGELCDGGAIARTARGVYYKTRYLGIFDKNISPSVNKEAEAVAKAKG